MCEWGEKTNLNVFYARHLASSSYRGKLYVVRDYSIVKDTLTN
jgi:hypothetical protein